MPALADARTQTARRNGALSRGPVTAAGKARSAMNATRHGLAARGLPGNATSAAVADMRAALLARWQPWDAAEAHQVEELVFAHWRQIRLRVLETMVLERLRAGEPLAGLPTLATVQRYRARVDRALARAAAELQALQAGRGRAADPARLRRLADEIEAARATARPLEPDDRAECSSGSPSGTNEPGRTHDCEKYTNELPSGTNEPTAGSAHAANSTFDFTAGTNEPNPARCGEAEKYTNDLSGGTNEPAPRLNRRQRRRLAALARRGRP